MEFKDLDIRFTDSAEEEVGLLIKELELSALVGYILKHDLPPELKGTLVQLIQVVTDLFSTELPELSDDPETTLRVVSRDINLSRILRERSIFRLYRLLHEKTWVDAFTGAVIDSPTHSQDAVAISIYQTFRNPNTGAPFATQEEFIGWLCESAHITRALIFQRMAAIDRLTNALGFSLQEAYRIILSKPSVIQQTLRDLARWDKQGGLEDVDPAVAMHIARRVAPERVDDLRSLAEQAGEIPEARELLKEAVRPMIASILSEVAAHDRAKDAMDWIKHDILMRPEITYAWDEESNVLMVVYHSRNVDPQTGEEYTSPPLSIPFVPDILDLPREVKADLVRRLPIRNRNELGLDV
jgi:hypothetical protein